MILMNDCFNHSCFLGICDLEINRYAFRQIPEGGWEFLYRKVQYRIVFEHR